MKLENAIAQMRKGVLELCIISIISQGEIYPSEIIKEANKRGIISIIDGAHAPGHIKLNITSLNVDYYSGNCHKWMMAPKGSAFLWANKNKKNILEPLVISHGWLPNNYKKLQKGEFTETRFIDSFEVQGTKDPSAWLTIPDAIKFINDKKYSNAFKESSKLAYKTALTISNLTKIPLLANREFLAPQMISIPIPKCNVDHVKTQLLKKFNIEHKQLSINDKKLPRPPFWGGYRIWIHQIEIWLNQNGLFTSRVNT